MNTDRYRDLLPLAPDGKPTGIEDFTRFLVEEAFPFIEGNYRTKDYRILVGPQAGADFGLATLFSGMRICSPPLSSTIPSAGGEGET